MHQESTPKNQPFCTAGRLPHACELARCLWGPSAGVQVGQAGRRQSVWAPTARQRRACLSTLLPSVQATPPPPQRRSWAVLIGRLQCCAASSDGRQ